MRTRIAGGLRWAGLLCALIAALGVGCGRREAQGRAGPRVISLSPNTTETVFALGASELLVGRSRHCDFPAAAAQLPAVGGFSDPSMEAIIALAPTLVVGSRSPAGPGLAESLAAHGIPSYFPATDSIADIQTMIRGLGQRLGRAAPGARLAARVDAEVQRVAQQATGKTPVRAVLVFDASPIVVAGPGGFPDELLKLAGGDNVIDEGSLYPTVNIERLIALDPDVVIDASGVGTGESGGTAASASALGHRPGWSELRAARQHRIHALQSSAALRPGPRIAVGLAEIYRALHRPGPEP